MTLAWLLFLCLLWLGYGSGKLCSESDTCGGCIATNGCLWQTTLSECVFNDDVSCASPSLCDASCGGDPIYAPVMDDSSVDSLKYFKITPDKITRPMGQLGLCARDECSTSLNRANACKTVLQINENVRQMPEKRSSQSYSYVCECASGWDSGPLHQYCHPSKTYGADIVVAAWRASLIKQLGLSPEEVNRLGGGTTQIKKPSVREMPKLVNDKNENPKISHDDDDDEDGNLYRRRAPNTTVPWWLRYENMTRNALATAQAPVEVVESSTNVTQVGLFISVAILGVTLLIVFFVILLCFRNLQKKQHDDLQKILASQRELMVLSSKSKSMPMVLNMNEISKLVQSATKAASSTSTSTQPMRGEPTPTNVVIYYGTPFASHSRGASWRGGDVHGDSVSLTQGLATSRAFRDPLPLGEVEEVYVDVWAPREKGSVNSSGVRQRFMYECSLTRPDQGELTPEAQPPEEAQAKEDSKLS